MEDDFLNNDLIDKFEQMLENKQQFYFDTEELYEIIAYYLDVGDLPFARKALEYAIQLHPDSIEIRIKELEYFLETENLIHAKDLIEELQEMGNNDTDFLVCCAKFWSLKNNPKRAIEYYQKALKFAEELDFIYNCIGNEYLNLKEYNKALYHYKKALELNLEDDFSFYSCLQCYDQMHLHNEAIKFLNQYIDLNPYSEMAWYEMGQLYFLQRNYQEAHRAFDYAIVVNPKSVTAHSQKALCLIKLDDYSAALDVYEEILEFDDFNGYTYLQIGKCYLKLNQPYKALQAFHKSIHEDPQLDKAWSETAELYEKLGNFEDAEYYLGRALEINNANTDYIKRHAYLNIQLGMFEESIHDFEQLLKLESNNFYNWLGISELLITVGDYHKAIGILLDAIKKFKRAELYYQISNCYFLTNQKLEGEQALNNALELDKNIQDEMYLKYPILQREASRIHKQKNS